MLRKIKHYLAALSVLLVLMGIYQVSLARLLQSPPIPRVPMAQGPVLDEDDSFSDLFPESAWQRGTCKRLQTADGAMLFENWSQTGPQSWRLWPVTIIVGYNQSPDGSSSPLVIEASEGAEIEFAESLDVLSGGAPPIRGGRMSGDVHIYRVAADAAAADGGEADKRDRRTYDSDEVDLDIRTSNVGIDHRKIWTTQTIRMKVGDATVIGRDLELHLSSTAAATAGGGDATTILDRMRLIYLDQLTMPIDNGQLWAESQAFDAAERSSAADSAKSVSGADEETEQAAAGGGAMLSLKCGGEVVYDFVSDNLVLHDSVSLVHQPAVGRPDRFDCLELRLKLNDPVNDSIVRRGPLDWLTDIEAVGVPAVVDLPSLDCELRAGSIKFNARQGLLEANGNSGVMIRYGQYRAGLSQLTYHFDPAQPKTIGAIYSDGPGKVVVDDAASPVRDIEWTKSFRMQPLGLATTEAISSEVGLWVDGKLRARLADGGSFAADSVEGVFKPDPRTKSSQSAGSRTASQRDQPTLVPDRFQASGKVHLDTAAIAAQTEQLTLFFVHSPDPEEGSAGSPAEQASSPSLRQWVAQPTAADSTGPVAPVARPRPTIRGNTITAQLNLAGGGIEAEDLSVIGDVEVIHTIQAGKQPLDAKLTGQELRLMDGGGEDMLQLGSGVQSPARFELGDGYFIGPRIQIWPNLNVVRINQAGEFQMPSAVLPTGLAASPGTGAGTAGGEETKLRWTDLPKCRWNESMVFDGKTARLTGGVHITAALINGREPWQVQMSGERLEVMLQNSVQLNNVQTIRQAAVREVTLHRSDSRPVVVEAFRHAPDGVLEARHLLEAPQLTLRPADGGTLVGSGPGSYRAWTVPAAGNPFAADRTLASGAAAGRPAAPASSRDAAGEAKGKSLTGIHLVYHESMTANLASQDLQFLRGVRIGVQPMENWSDPFDAQRMNDLSVDQSTLDCDQLRLAIAPGYAGATGRYSAAVQPWEMLADGGVVFRTRTENGLMEGMASRATYASIKDHFTISGLPSRPAVFRKTAPTGQPGPELAVRSMTILPRTMEFIIHQFEGFNLGTLPANMHR